MSRIAATTQSRAEILSAFMRGVYQWMTMGLLLTAAVAYFVAGSPAMLQFLFGNQIVFFVLLFGTFGLAIGISAGISKLSAGAASGLFLLYSGMMGMLLSSVLLVYTGASIFSTFVTCAALFGSMSVYGMVTKRDLTGMGHFMGMGLWGLIIAMVVNIFMQSPAMTFVISGLGVIIFTGLTAYDTQKLRQMGESAPEGDATALRRGTILGALTLYLDFINLFLFLLRFMGAGRD